MGKDSLLIEGLELIPDINFVNSRPFYRVFRKEGHTESGSNLINFWPGILPKAF